MAIEIYYDRHQQLVGIVQNNLRTVWLTPKEASQAIKEISRVLRDEVYCLECKGVGFDPPTGEICMACNATGFQGGKVGE